jgi:hypothetical protein
VDGVGGDGAAGRGSRGSVRRRAGLAVGCAAVAGATAVVFLTEDPQLLRIAVVAVAWACLLAAFASARPAPDAGSPAAGASSEADLRAAHGRELAAVRDTERERSERLRRDAEDAMRRELDALRAEVAGLREGLSGLDGLAREVAAVGALHGDLRAELAELTGLRADVGRLRAEITDGLGAGRLSGEMRVERVVMHAQSVRTGSGHEPATAAWSAGVARELSDWPAVPAPPATVVAEAAHPEPEPRPTPRPEPRPLPAVPAPPPTRAAGSPREWLAARGLLDDAVPAPAAAPAPPPPPGRRRTDPPAGLRMPAAYEQVTVQRPAVHATAAAHAAVPAVPASVGAPDEEAGSARLAQILAESGVTPGGRRRRYRD